MQRPTTHAPRAGCSLCTIITTLRNTGSSSNQSTPVDVDHAYRTPWNPNLSPNLSSPTVQGGSRFPNSPTAHVPLTVPSSASGSSASNSADGRRAVYMDEDLSVWAADRSTGEALASGERHLVLAFNAHVESVYEFVSSSTSMSRERHCAECSYMIVIGTGRCTTLGTNVEDRQRSARQRPVRSSRFADGREKDRFRCRSHP